jgi:hypothetical protein
MRQQSAVEAIRERQFYVVYYRGEPLVRVRTPAASKSVVRGAGTSRRRAGEGARVVKIQTLEQLAVWLLFSFALIAVYGMLVML